LWFINVENLCAAFVLSKIAAAKSTVVQS